MICPLFGTCIYFFSLKTSVFFLPLASGKDTRALEKVIVFGIFLSLWRFLSAFCCYWTEIRLGLFSRHSCIFMCFIIRLPGKRNRRQSGKKEKFLSSLLCCGALHLTSKEICPTTPMHPPPIKGENIFVIPSRDMQGFSGNGVAFFYCAHVFSSVAWREIPTAKKML